MSKNHDGSKSTSSMKDFEIQKKLGTGSFGIVYKVSRKIDRKIYVLKQINISQMNKKQRSEAIMEVKILASLKDKYIVTYYDSFIEDKNLNIIMEYCENGDLSMYLKKQMPGKYVSEGIIWKYFIEVCLALKYLHSQNILHRDIKSMNVFLTKDDHVRLGDLGVAKVLTHTSNFARTIVGTPYYLSPELCQEKPYNQKSDIWSLGCVLYELCSLKHPFDSNNQGALIFKIIKGKYNPIPSCYTRELTDITNLCLNKDYKKRPSIYEILAQASIQSKAKILNIEIPNIDELPISKSAKRSVGGVLGGAPKRPEVRSAMPVIKEIEPQKKKDLKKKKLPSQNPEVLPSNINLDVKKSKLNANARKPSPIKASENNPFDYQRKRSPARASQLLIAEAAKEKEKERERDREKEKLKKEKEKEREKEREREREREKQREKERQEREKFIREKEKERERMFEKEREREREREERKQHSKPTSNINNQYFNRALDQRKEIEQKDNINPTNPVKKEKKPVVYSGFSNKQPIVQTKQNIQKIYYPKPKKQHQSKPKRVRQGAPTLLSRQAQGVSRQKLVKPNEGAPFRAVIEKPRNEKEREKEREKDPKSSQDKMLRDFADEDEIDQVKLLPRDVRDNKSKNANKKFHILKPTIRDLMHKSPKKEDSSENEQTTHSIAEKTCKQLNDMKMVLPSQEQHEGQEQEQEQEPDNDNDKDKENTNEQNTENTDKTIDCDQYMQQLLGTEEFKNIKQDAKPDLPVDESVHMTEFLSHTELKKAREVVGTSQSEFKEIPEAKEETEEVDRVDGVNPSVSVMSGWKVSETIKLVEKDKPIPERRKWGEKPNIAADQSPEKGVVEEEPLAFKGYVEAEFEINAVEDGQEPEVIQAQENERKVSSNEEEEEKFVKDESDENWNNDDDTDYDDNEENADTQSDNSAEEEEKINLHEYDDDDFERENSLSQNTNPQTQFHDTDDNDTSEEDYSTTATTTTVDSNLIRKREYLTKKLLKYTKDFQKLQLVYDKTRIECIEILGQSAFEECYSVFKARMDNEEDVCTDDMKEIEDCIEDTGEFIYPLYKLIMQDEELKNNQKEIKSIQQELDRIS